MRNRIVKFVGLLMFSVYVCNAMSRKGAAVPVEQLSTRSLAELERLKDYHPLLYAIFTCEYLSAQRAEGVIAGMSQEQFAVQRWDGIAGLPSPTRPIFYGVRGPYIDPVLLMDAYQQMGTGCQVLSRAFYRRMQELEQTRQKKAEADEKERVHAAEHERLLILERIKQDRADGHHWSENGV